MAKKNGKPKLGLYCGEEEQPESKSPSENGADREKEPNAEAQPSREAIHRAIADNLRDTAGASFLYATVASSFSSGIDPQAFPVYRDKLLKEAGNPTDPIEIMLIEQLALAHFNIGRLQLKSSSVQDAKLAVAYSDAATRLLGEFRRCTLALEDYRAKQVARKAGGGGVEETEESPVFNGNGKSRPSTNGKKPINGQKKPHDAKQSANGEIPQCLKDRMNPSTPVVLPLTN